MAREGEGGGVEAGECARSKFTASSPAESRSTEHLSFFVICLYFNIPEQLRFFLVHHCIFIKFRCFVYLYFLKLNNFLLYAFNSSNNKCR